MVILYGLVRRAEGSIVGTGKSIDLPITGMIPMIPAVLVTMTSIAFISMDQELSG